MPDYPVCAHCGGGWPHPARPRLTFAESVDRITGEKTPVHEECVEAYQLARSKRYSAQVRGKVTSTKRPFKGSK